MPQNLPQVLPPSISYYIPTNGEKGVWCFVAKKEKLDDKTAKVRIRASGMAGKGSNTKWIVNIFIWTFVLSVVISIASSVATERLNVGFAFLILLLIVLVGILFDMIGIAVTAADETPFHALGARKFKNAQLAVTLIRNAEKVSNFCNDVIGDIAGIISGTTSAVIVTHLFSNEGSSIHFYMSVVMTGLVASLTVGGKAIGKTFAMKNCNNIIYAVSKVVSWVVPPRQKRRK